MHVNPSDGFLPHHTRTNHFRSIPAASAQADTVDLPDRKLCWLGGKILFFSMKSVV